MDKGEIPDYINCNSKYLTHCDFYMHNDCPETCNFAKDIKTSNEETVLGIGAMDAESFEGLSRIIESNLKKGGSADNRTNGK